MRTPVLVPLLWLGVAAPAQAPLGPPVEIRVDVATADPAEGTPARTRIDLAAEVLRDGGPREEVVRHLLAALELHPASPAILRELLAVSAEDPDARALWGVAFALACCDDRGRPQLERSDRDLLPAKGDVSRDVARAQADAIAELARFASRLRGRDAGDGVLARWAADLAIDLGREAPRVLDAHAEELTHAVEGPRPDFDTIFAALRELLDAEPVGTSADPEEQEAERVLALDRAIRAARILTGLAAQVGFGKDLKGPPPPDLGDLPQRARESLERIRRRVAERVGEPWTVEELHELGEEERVLFTERHATWANPAVAVSPNRRYTIQTTCGFETLLGAAETIEDHHARLVNWFGSDPFRDRPGVVRLEPEHDGLESNGAPFWWAGGFQSGDRTVMRFAWGSIEGLGRGLTHELTHRFDGTFHPFMPAWLVEGRAVWTGRSYGRISDEHFIEDYLEPHAIQGPYVKGYGNVRNLTKLLDGSIDDYRDNYSAGYALFTYLETWKGASGAPLFAEPLARFMKNARGGRSDPVGFFVDHFADGKDGRPAGLEAFAAGFREFMHQCYRWAWGPEEQDEQNAWIRTNYRLDRVGGSEWRGTVMDAPTFSWARDRAEPWFGQGHALAAGELLAEVGDAKAAAAALCWSLQVDGWRSDNAPLCADQLEAIGQRDAAWTVRREAARRILSLEDPHGEAPMLGKLSKLRALSKELREASDAHAERGLALAAAGFAERHDRIAAAVGAGQMAVPAPVDSDSDYPRIGNPHALATLGWVEDGLTGYEERRVPGLWYETEMGDVHVGRNRPRDATGAMDRRAHQRHAFVRSVEWMAPGRYVVHARVHFTTSFVAGAVVFGWTRRDRNLRLRFSAGDFLYSIGRKEDGAKTKAVSLRLDALWERDGNLPEAAPGEKFEFEQPSSYVDLELRVDGPSVDCYAMGEYQFSYTTPDLTPIEGAVGFATSQGAVRVQTPTVQRLDRGALLAPDDPERDILSMVRRPLPGVPVAENGTIVVWIPRDADTEYLVNEARRALLRLAKPLKDPLHYPQRWVLMVPADLPEEARADIDRVVRTIEPDGLAFVPHVRVRPPEDEVWVLFVDAQGVLRAAGSAEVAIPRSVAGWARRYRPPVREVLR